MLESKIASVAIPAASALVSSTANLSQRLSSGFTGLLQGTPSETCCERGTESDSAEPKLPSLESLVTQVRNWLSQNSAGGGPYEIQLSLESDGESSISVSGVDAQEIERLLDAGPTWQSQLRSFALAYQEQFGSNSTDPLSRLSLAITEAGWRITRS